MPPKKAAASRISVKPNALEGVSVIITGDIEGQTRSSANEILSTSGAIIEKSLNKTVQLVVLGENAGDKKLDKVNELGLETKEWDELIEEIRADDDQDEELEDSEQEDKPKRKDKGKAGTKANSRGKPNPPPEKKTASIESATSPSIVGKTVLITGTVPGHDRKSAQKIVEDAGATVAKSLNKQVEVAILGTNAGPDKLKIIEESGIDTIRWNALAAELGIEVPPEKEVADVQSGEPPDSIDGMTLLITGTIGGYTRASAEKLLKSAGAKFTKSISQTLELVVLGTKPGDDKLNQIAAMDIPTTTFGALVEKLGLASQADEPPKKKTKKA